MSDANATQTPATISPEDRERQMRLTAIHAAMATCVKGDGDYQEVIRAAREILAFLKDG